MSTGGQPTTRPLPASAGVGLRLPHLAEVVATRPPVPWFEIHPETFLANPHAVELLVQVAEHYPVSVHTVGVSIGSAHGLDRDHLRRVRAIIDLINPSAVSGHVAWSTHPGEYLNDLLPLPYDEATVALLGDHIGQVQDALDRPYLVENPSSYVGFLGSTMSEPEFLSALVRRSGCQLVCDISNIHLSSRNMGFDARRYVDELPGDAIREFHLGGYEAEDDPATPGATLLVDTHGTPVSDPAWDLYAYAIRRFGIRPTLIEWDNELPPLATLIGEARRADRVAASVVPGNVPAH